MPNYKESEYYYSSAKIAAMSGKLIPSQVLLSLCDSASYGAALDRLREYGVEPVNYNGKPDTELTLASYSASMFSTLAGFLPDGEIVGALRAEYDCHNIKTAVKCRYLKTDPEPYFIAAGSVPPEAAVRAADTGDFSAVYPETIASAAGAAAKKLDSDGDLRSFESAVDRSCFDRLSELAGSFGYPTLADIISLKSDLLNLVTASRIRRVKNPDTAKLLASDAFVPGGRIPREKFYPEGESSPALPLSALEPLLSEEELRQITNAASNERPDVLSAACDRVLLSYIRRACGREQLGIKPVILFIATFVYAVKDLRIILSGLESGKPGAGIKEELIF